jgi:predicted ribosome quality control (RQC) complex YloA/Tae2 family protein
MDFEGNTIKIPLPKNITRNRFSEYYFNLARKAQAKSKRVHLEKENLESKLFFYENILASIESSDNPHDIELLLPKKGGSLKKKEKLKKGELYWIEGYKVFVGRNSGENQYLLGIAKANDVWMHIRGIPSSHIIIRTDKQNLPDSLLNAAAKLCIDTSVRNAGDYEVDYTKRKFVKIQEGSNVEYDKYNTIRVRKEGIEIRE